MKSHHIKNVLFIVLITILPWFNSNLFDDTTPNKNTEFNNTYFEINPCKISLAEFVYFEDNISGFNFIGDTSSPIYCFGRISSGNDGATLKIGTNFFVSTLIIFFLLGVLIRKTPLLSKPIGVKNIYFSSLLFTVILIIGLVLSDNKYYENSAIFYFLKQSELLSISYLTIFIFLILNLLIKNYEIDNRVLINYTPYLFLFSGLISKSNLNVWTIIFIYFGFNYMRINKKSHFYNIYLFLIFFWAINASTTFIKTPIIFLGFTSTSYDFYSIIFYSIFFFLVFYGVKHLVNNQMKYFDLSKLLNNFYIVILFKLLINFLTNQSNVIEFIFEFLFGEINKNDFSFGSFFTSNNELIFLILILSVYHSANKKHLNIKTLVVLVYFVLNITNYLNEIKYSIDNFKEFLISYNPTFLEFIIGSGPLNLNQFLSETAYDIYNIPITSSNSIVIFFGMLGCLIFSIIYIYFLTEKKYSTILKFFGSLLVFNFLIGSGINTISFFVLYLSLYFLTKNNYFSKNFFPNK